MKNKVWEVMFFPADGDEKFYTASGNRVRLGLYKTVKNAKLAITRKSEEDLNNPNMIGYGTQFIIVPVEVR